MRTKKFLAMAIALGAGSRNDSYANTGSRKKDIGIWRYHL